MALNDVTISFDLNQILGGDFDQYGVMAYVVTNVPNNTLMDTSTGEIRLGEEMVTIGADGTGSFTTWGVGPDGNPTSWQTTLVVEYRKVGSRNRPVRRFGPYTIEDIHDGLSIAELEDEQAIPPNYQSAFVADMEAIRDEAEAARDAAVDISNIDTSDGVVSTLIEGAAGAGPLTRSALSASTGAPIGRRSVRGEGTKAYTRHVDGTPQSLRWVGLLDSIADLKMRFLFNPLNRAFGGGMPGAAISDGQTSTGWSIPGTGILATTGTVTGATTDFDAWISGRTSRFATGATRTYGIGGVNATWDSAKVYYIKGPSSPDGGTFKVQVAGVDEGSTVDTANASIALGVVTISKGSVAQRELKVVNLTGAHRIVGVAFFNSAQGGLIYSSVSQGGIRLDTALTTGSEATFGTFLADFQPDVISFEAKEESSYLAAELDTLLDIVEANAPTTTFLGIGSTPTATGDADQIAQNTILRNACVTRGHLYWDGYGPMQDYATMDALGWDGDGIHVDDKASHFLAGLMLNDLGLLSPPGLVSARDFDADTGRVRSTLNFGAPRVDGAQPNGVLSIPDTLDILLKLRRKLSVTWTDGVTDQVSWIIGPVGDQRIPHGVQVGTGPYLQASSTQVNVMSARGGGSARDIYARSFVAAFSNLGNVTGAQTLDLSTASVFRLTLTGNVSIAHSNIGNSGQEIEIHFVQDATGSRTVGFSAFFKLAGGAFTATTTAGKRDVIRFRNDGGIFYETSRSLNVG